MQDFRVVIGLVGLYFMVILGMVVYGRVKSTDSFLPGLNEFFLAGKSLSPLVLTFTFAGSLFSTFSVLAYPSLFYVHGLSSALMLAMFYVLGLPMIFYVGKKLRSYSLDKRIFSPVEVISHKYGSRRLGLFIAVVFAVLLMPYISLQLVGIGAFIEAYTDGQITYFWGVGAMMVIVLLYLFLGGMRVVAYTDFIQLAAIMIGLTVGLIYIFNHYDVSLIGLFSSIKEASPEHLWVPGPKGEYGYFAILSMSLMIVGILFQPHVLTRTMMAKDDSDIRYMLIGTTIGAIAITVLAAGYGLLTYITYGAGIEPNLMMGYVFEKLSQVGIWGLIISTLMIMGALGAAMSTADSLLLAIGQVCTRDMIRPFFKISRGRQVLLAKFIMFVVLLVAFFTGLQPPKYMMDLALYSGAGCTLLIPTILCIDWSRRSLLASYTSIIISAGILTFMVINQPDLTGFLAELHVGTIPMVISFILYFGICFLRTPRLADQQ